MLRIILFLSILLPLLLVEALRESKSLVVIGYEFRSRFHGIRNIHNNNNVHFMAPSQKNADIQAIIARTELLVVVPVSAVGLKQVSGLKAALLGELNRRERMSCFSIFERSSLPPGEPRQAALSKAQLVEIIDRTPFCQIAEELSGQSICVFVENSANENVERLLKWLRVTKKEGNATYISIFEERSHSQTHSDPSTLMFQR